MVVRLRAALCGMAILCAWSSSGIAKLTNDKDDAAASTAHTRADPEVEKHMLNENLGQRGRSIIGAASMYNPFEPGAYEGPIETGSGENYDLDAWTAAIQTRFRKTFGGIRYGTQYQPAYALVEAVGKRAIIKINDVGPLEPGRVIDLSKKTMAYFDPSLQKGVIPRREDNSAGGQAVETRSSRQLKAMYRGSFRSTHGSHRGNGFSHRRHRKVACVTSALSFVPSVGTIK